MIESIVTLIIIVFGVYAAAWVLVGLMTFLGRTIGVMAFILLLLFLIGRVSIGT